MTEAEKLDAVFAHCWNSFAKTGFVCGAWDKTLWDELPEEERQEFRDLMEEWTDFLSKNLKDA